MSYPQLILLGNGINRAYSGGSWNDMLRAITQREDLPAIFRVMRLKANFRFLSALYSCKS